MLSILRHNQRKDPSNRKATISTERRSTTNKQINYLIAAGDDDVSGRLGETTSMEQMTQQLVAKQALAGKPMNRSGFKARSISIDEVSSGSSRASSQKEPEKLVGKVVDNELINQHMHDAFKKLGQEAK